MTQTTTQSLIAPLIIDPLRIAHGTDPKTWVDPIIKTGDLLLRFTSIMT
jgi:hypothetical protein